MHTRSHRKRMGRRTRRRGAGDIIGKRAQETPRGMEVQKRAAAAAAEASRPRLFGEPDELFTEEPVLDAQSKAEAAAVVAEALAEGKRTGWIPNVNCVKNADGTFRVVAKYPDPKVEGTRHARCGVMSTGKVSAIPKPEQPPRSGAPKAGRRTRRRRRA